MQETAYAKINLALHVRERMSNGYHRIETIFAFVEDGDLLSVASCDHIELDITGPFAGDLAADPDNLVLRAALALRERFGVADGARLTLDKRLPIAAGIGGGSADAAAALRLLSRWWNLEASEAGMLDIAARIGADVPACLRSRPARGEGRGDALTPIMGSLTGKPVLLVNPGVKLSTGDVFAEWNGVDGGRLEDWRSGGNDLEVPAIGLVPEIVDVLLALDGAEFARMSGSGATCFGLFADERDRSAAAQKIAAEHPSWWLMSTRLR